MAEPTTTQTTPGPWRWFKYPDGRKLLSGRDRAVIHCPDAPMSCDPADMALIASAPDLLAALKCIDRDDVTERVWEQIAAAIALAESRS